MKGKIVMITGATGGIGKATAIGLARMGADLVLVGRNDERLAAIEDRVLKEGCGSATTLRADLSSMEEVRWVGTELKNTLPRLDVLINNVGVIVPERRTTVDGYEYTFALDHLCSFLLTNLLIDKLKASAPSRIINVSSSAHILGKVHFDDLMLEKGYSPFKAYGQAKLANILFTRELARRLEGTGVTANSLHPGLVKTHFGLDLKGVPRLGTSIIRPFGIGPEKGAKTSIYLASSPEVNGLSGKYFVQCKPAWSTKRSKDEDDALRLWEVSEKLTGTKSAI
jgi:NAD(P)-dependent dehydrogenase (short-subunit alcohol dehydrogenase family)